MWGDDETAGASAATIMSTGVGRERPGAAAASRWRRAISRRAISGALMPETAKATVADKKAADKKAELKDAQTGADGTFGRLTEIAWQALPALFTAAGFVG